MKVLYIKPNYPFFKDMTHINNCAEKPFNGKRGVDGTIHCIGARKCDVLGFQNNPLKRNEI